MSVPRDLVSRPTPVNTTVNVEPISRRIKVYGLPDGYDVETMRYLTALGEKEKCDKLIFYVKRHDRKTMKERNFVYEGYIGGFFRGETAYIYATFLNPERNRPVTKAEAEQVMERVRRDNKESVNPPLPKGYIMTYATKEDAKEMSRLYDRVFETYPTPMNDPSYIEEMMDQQVYFTLVKYRGRIVSASSADLLPTFNSAELTDCATLPAHRNHRLLSHQFSCQIQRMKRKGVQTLFCYARAVSTGMNLISVRNGFTCGGRMVQNSNIDGRLECMNIWFKKLF
ncbi:putative beta-lysine N-acetyltransferase [Desmospora profundinema]|uniref:Beta-lysine N-acetyltransferase n=1 Tax=Desmospora profundinema TaxID=1571184 RepID=A0ABU1IK15_9BACL|nr:putative beta-lysine N-acetyltransferase [Desmospora profundinema]MDR6225103.1 putative beta-lysine N-acetyltransferase [Desmospora profundinema]